MTEPIDEFLPLFHFRERHVRRIEAPPSQVAAQLRDVELARSPLIGPLFVLRSLPARLARIRSRHSDPVRAHDPDAGQSPGAGQGNASGALQAGRLGHFLDAAFVTLRDDPARGLVVGAVGAFWRSAGGVRRIAPAQFATDRTPGLARLAWMFDFQPLDQGRACLAVTETRIHGNDAAARRAMRCYWLLIRPASGLIRREILRLLARRCADSAPPR